MNKPIDPLQFADDAQRDAHNLSVIIAFPREVIMKLGDRELCRFPKGNKNSAEILKKLRENPKATAWTLNTDTVKLEPLVGFVSPIDRTPAPEPPPAPAEPAPDHNAPVASDVPARPRRAKEDALRAEPPAIESKVAPPMKRTHKPPTHIRTTTTLNEFVGPNGELSWPDVKKGWDGQFVPKASCANARVAILALEIDCCHDVFHDKKVVGGHAIEQWAGELSDDACQMLRVRIQKHFGFDPGRENVHDAAIQLCLHGQFDPVLDYLDGLSWDGKARLDRWLIDYLGAENTELNRVIGRLALVAAVRRARQPGCKFDQIIVLEGVEGTEKSTAIVTMAGEENFSDQTILGLNEKSHMELIKGKWLYEIADLAGMRRGEVEAVKAFASRRTDRGRPAYGRHVVEQPRRCVFFATTNDNSYLKSQTGNRRFWPVKTGRIAIDALRRDRDQLWAEAAQAEAAGKSIKLPERLWSTARVEQDKRLEHDPWDDILDGAKGEIWPLLQGDEERISSCDLLLSYLKIPAERVTKEAEKKLAKCMRRLGWDGPDKMQIGAKPQRGYRRLTGSPITAAPENASQSRAPWKR